VAGSIRLSELDAEFFVIESPTLFRRVDILTGSNGLMFLCPKCYAEKGDTIGVHRVICWFVGVDPAIDPKPGRWNPSGTGIDDITFVGPGAASVLLTAGCRWHGFIRNGAATL
jgi:hypothetical protein